MLQDVGGLLYYSPEPNTEEQAKADRRLCVGCGDFPLFFWTNLDSNPEAPADIHEDALTYLQGCPEGRYDEIYAGHFIEHMDFDTGYLFLKECYRVLSSGGRIGITVPDMGEILRCYVQQEAREVEFPSGYFWDVRNLNHVNAIFIYSNIQTSLHRWSYDQRTLAAQMKRAGFVNLQRGDGMRDQRVSVGSWWNLLMDGYKNG